MMFSYWAGRTGSPGVRLRGRAAAAGTTIKTSHQSVAEWKCSCRSPGLSPHARLRNASKYACKPSFTGKVWRGCESLPAESSKVTEVVQQRHATFICSCFTYHTAAPGFVRRVNRTSLFDFILKTFLIFSFVLFLRKLKVQWIYWGNNHIYSSLQGARPQSYQHLV